MKVADLRSEDLPHRDGFRRDDIHGDVPCAKRGSHLESDEARANHHRSLRRQRLGDQRAAVGEGAQIMDVWEIRARHVEPHRHGARGEQQRVIHMASAVNKLHVPTCGVDRGHSSV